MRALVRRLFAMERANPEGHTRSLFDHSHLASSGLCSYTFAGTARNACIMNVPTGAIAASALHKWQTSIDDLNQDSSSPIAGVTGTASVMDVTTSAIAASTL